MLNKELEHSLNRAFLEAREKRHEFITVEHILLMLECVRPMEPGARNIGTPGDNLVTPW